MQLTRNGSIMQTTTFLDLCAAGTPLAAIAACLLDSGSRDVLHLAQAVGKQYRRCVLETITELPDLKLQFDGVSARDSRAGARLLLQLDNVERVSAACNEYGESLLCDAEGLTLLRLLPRLRHLRLDTLPQSGDFIGTCCSLTALTTLEELHIGWWWCSESEVLVDDPSVQEAASHVAQLTQLTRLNMSNFFLAADGIKHLTGLAALRELDLGYENYLSDACLAPLSTLPHLTKLSARCACVNEETLMHIGTLTGLRELDLSAAAMVEPEHVWHLSRLASLTELLLAYNTLSGSSIKALGPLRSLAVLDISSTQICECDLVHLSALRALRSLDCSCNSLGPAAARYIGSCRQLRSLCVDQNSFGPEGVHHLTMLSGLQHLSIMHNGIGAVGASHIANSLTALTSLHISSNVLGSAGAAHIARMTQLQALQVMNNNLDGVAVQMLIGSLLHLSDREQYRSLKHQLLSQRRRSMDA